MEELGCTGLCLIKKLEEINAQLEEKKANKDFPSEDKILKKPENRENPSAPCTGMCALMKQRTG